jgi:hypothetical protein
MGELGKRKVIAKSNGLARRGWQNYGRRRKTNLRMAKVDPAEQVLSTIPQRGFRLGLGELSFPCVILMAGCKKFQKN